MASTASPYGLRPINIQGGQPMSHGIRLMKIASGYATNIFNGDLVTIATTGFVEKDAGTATALPVGVFLGCEYQDTAMGLLNRQYWPAGTVQKANTFAWAYVCDDPDALFEIQASASLTIAALQGNAALIQGAGSTATGNSGVSLNAATVAATATLPLRIVDFVDKQGFSTIGDAFTDVIVRINTHLNRSATGIA